MKPENAESPTELLPCPFCGRGDCLDLTDQYDEDGRWAVICNGCKVTTAFCVNEARAVKRWNTRALTPGVSGQAPRPFSSAGHELDCELGMTGKCSCGLDAAREAVKNKAPDAELLASPAAQDERVEEITEWAAEFRKLAANNHSSIYAEASRAIDYLLSIVGSQPDREQAARAVTEALLTKVQASQLELARYAFKHPDNEHDPWNDALAHVTAIILEALKQQEIGK